MSECTVDNLVYLRELLGLGRALDKLDNDAVGSDVSEGKPLLESLEVPLPGLVVVNEVCLPDLPDLLNFPLELALDKCRLLRELQVLLIAGNNNGRLLGQDGQVVKDFIEDVSGLSEFLPIHRVILRIDLLLFGVYDDEDGAGLLVQDLVESLFEMIVPWDVHDVESLGHFLPRDLHLHEARGFVDLDRGDRGGDLLGQEMVEDGRLPRVGRPTDDQEVLPRLLLLPCRGHLNAITGEGRALFLAPCSRLMPRKHSEQLREGKGSRKEEQSM